MGTRASHCSLVTILLVAVALLAAGCVKNGSEVPIVIEGVVLSGPQESMISLDTVEALPSGSGFDGVSEVEVRFAQGHGSIATTKTDERGFFHVEANNLGGTAEDYLQFSAAGHQGARFGGLRVGKGTLSLHRGSNLVVVHLPMSPGCPAKKKTS